MKKVVLANLGEFEFYCYPFDYPDKVFLGKFPISTTLCMNDVKQMMGISATLRWFIEGKAFIEPNWRKGVNARRRAIQKAYDLALNELISKKKARISPNYNSINNKEKKQV